MFCNVDSKDRKNNASINPKYSKIQHLKKNNNRLENFKINQWNKEISVGLTGAFLCSKIFGIRINLDDVEDLLKKNNFLCHCIPDNKFLIIEFLQNYEENQIKNIIFKEFKIKINFIKTFRVKSFSKNSLFK